MTRQPNSTESVDPLADLTSEELSCLGLRRVNAFTEWLADLDRQALEACAAQQPKPPKPRKPPKPNLRTLVKQAEQATGQPVTSVTMPDGTKLDFSKPEPTETENPWRLDEFRTKETKR